MKLVIDANIVFAAFIKDSFTRKMIFRTDIELVAPQFLLKEIEKYSPYLQKKSKTTKKEFKHLKELVFSKITIVQKKEFQQHLKKAEKITPDKDDKQYFALALKTGNAIWSNESRLKKQQEVKILTTKELSTELLEEDAERIGHEIKNAVWKRAKKRF